MNEVESRGSGAPLNIAYILTHYPRVATTFITGEIEEIERLGGAITPFVMNEPSSADLTTQEARSASERSIYLKKRPSRVIAAAFLTFVLHPFGMSRLLWVALRSARWDLGLIVRRIAHLSYATVVARLCHARSIHHLHAHFGQAPATIAWFAAELMRLHGPTRATWSFTIHGFQDFVDEAVARLDLKAQSASFIVCISDFTRSQLCRVADPIYWERFHVVRCGIDLQRFPPRRLRSSVDLARVVVVGRLSPEKGHVVLLNALKILTDNGNKVELEIIGAGPFERAIRKHQEHLGLDRVRYCGELTPDKISRRLADADVFCMPSFSEGLPVSIMEAMAVGVPVVTTWISGIPELAENGVTALTVPPGNSTALAAALERAIFDKVLTTRLVASARDRVEQMHSMRKNVGQLASLFEEHMMQRSTRGPAN